MLVVIGTAAVVYYKAYYKGLPGDSGNLVATISALMPVVADHHILLFTPGVNGLGCALIVSSDQRRPELY